MTISCGAVQFRRALTEGDFMQKTWTAFLIAGMVALGGCTNQITKGDDHDDDRDDDKEIEVTLEQCPEAVRAALMKESAGGKIEEIEKEMDEGKWVYIADVRLSGKKWEIEISTDGQVIEKELDTEDDDEDEVNGKDDDKD
jgi:uncharacterized membrane protein YkoI